MEHNFEIEEMVGPPSYENVLQIMFFYRAYTAYNARDTALGRCNAHEVTIAVERRPRIKSRNRLRYRSRAQRKSPMNSKQITRIRS